MRTAWLAILTFSLLASCNTPPEASQPGQFAPIDPVRLSAVVGNSASGKIALRNTGAASLTYDSAVRSTPWISIRNNDKGTLSPGETRIMDFIAVCSSQIVERSGNITLIPFGQTEVNVPLVLSCEGRPAGSLDIRTSYKQPFSSLWNITEGSPVKIELVERATGRIVGSKETIVANSIAPVRFDNIQNGTYDVVGKVQSTPYNVLDALPMTVQIRGDVVSAVLEFPLTSHEPNVLQGELTELPEGAQLQLQTPVSVSKPLQVGVGGIYRGSLEIPGGLTRLKELGVPAYAQTCKNTLEISDPEAHVSLKSLDPRVMISTTVVLVGGKGVGIINETGGSSQFTPISVGRIYTDRPISVKASFSCGLINGMNHSISLSLETGWNYVLLDQTGSNIKTTRVFSSPGALIKSKWKPAP